MQNTPERERRREPRRGWRTRPHRGRRFRRLRRVVRRWGRVHGGQDRGRLRLGDGFHGRSRHRLDQRLQVAQAREVLDRRDRPARVGRRAHDLSAQAEELPVAGPQRLHERRKRPIGRCTSTSFLHPIMASPNVINAY